MIKVLIEYQYHSEEGQSPDVGISSTGLSLSAGPMNIVHWGFLMLSGMIQNLTALPEIPTALQASE